jgi:transposase
MPTPKPEALELSEEMEREIERLLNAHKTPQQIAQRLRIIQGAGEGKNNSEIAREYQIDVKTARRWRKRWLEKKDIPLEKLSVEDRLRDQPRPGAPARITANQVCEMIQIACEAPEKSGRPISHWTGREIADELMERGIVESISPRHARRLFKRSRSQAAPHPLLADNGKG